MSLQLDRYIIGVAMCSLFSCTAVQQVNKAIREDEVERIEKALSSDAMAGRRLLSPELDKAADLIADELKKAGVSPMPGNDGFLQRFTLLQPKFRSANGQLNNNEVMTRNIFALTTQPELQVNEKSGYRVVHIGAKDDVRKQLLPLMNADENLLILLDTAQARTFGRLNRFKTLGERSAFSQIVILTTDTVATTFNFLVKHDIEEKVLRNVVGYLPGKSRKDEFVIFSGHYDHLGIGKPDAKGDSIYNGANDDASGITAMLQLARYYKMAKENERSLLFVAFTGEETGGYGSKYFSEHIDPDKVTAMFNIEMIGTDSKWGPNAVYITGYDKSDLGKIMEKDLEGSGFKCQPDPYIKQNLFLRSDNARLAMLGVPAHTISTSKMDEEKNYHQPSDEVSTLDLKNMTRIIRSIAIGARSIVAGKATPTRVKPEDVK